MRNEGIRRRVGIEETLAEKVELLELKFLLSGNKQTDRHGFAMYSW